jgi:hypothetical protein
MAVFGIPAVGCHAYMAQRTLRAFQSGGVPALGDPRAKYGPTSPWSGARLARRGGQHEPNKGRSAGRALNHATCLASRLLVLACHETPSMSHPPIRTTQSRKQSPKARAPESSSASPTPAHLRQRPPSTLHPQRKNRTRPHRHNRRRKHRSRLLRLHGPGPQQRHGHPKINGICVRCGINGSDAGDGETVAAAPAVSRNSLRKTKKESYRWCDRGIPDSELFADLASFEVDRATQEPK